MSTGPIAPIIKGIAAGIGLASEYRHHRKAQQAAKEAAVVTERAIPEDSYDTPTEAHEPRSIHAKDAKLAEHEVTEVADDDEKQWILNEVQDEVSSAGEPKLKVKTERDPKKMIDQFTAARPLTENHEHHGLVLPVVLPQRRPKDRTRGFIRAYAPVLQDCDIDQESFLELVETFNAATLAAPWLDAINLASLAFVMLPTAISQAVSIAIAIAVDITKNMQSRHRHNYVLDQLNTDYFRPRGLYALVLTWNPDDDGMKVSVNLNETIADNMASRNGLLDKATHSFRPSMGNTVGVAFSETAPLVFPALDSLVNNETPQSTEFKQKFKHAKGLVGEYFDRRAQAEHAGLHSDSQLAVTSPVFTSKYSDPNHPSNSGDLLALITGGKLNMPRRRGLLGQRRRMFLDDRFERRDILFSRSFNNTDQTRGRYDQAGAQGVVQRQSLSPGFGPGVRNGWITGGIKRIFQHHILYLAIINMPTDEEMAEANEHLNRIRTSS